MSMVADILASKGTAVHTVDKQQTVLEAVEAMVANNVGSLIVTDGEAVFGIFTERDYLRRIVLEGRRSHTTRVGEVATERLVAVDPSVPVEDCMAIMTRERIRHLPVMDHRGLAGLISIGDIVKHLSREREAEIHYLRDYIAGRYPG